MATEYGKRLRKARKDAKLTQEGLSKKTGIAQSTISTSEREGNGSGNTLVYAKVCGVDALWLATGNAEAKPVTSALDTPFDNIGPSFSDDADPMRSLRAVYYDVPLKYRRKALTAALQAMADWISPSHPEAIAEPPYPDAATNMSAVSRNAKATD